MHIVDRKGTIPNSHDRGYELLGNQKRQKIPQLWCDLVSIAIAASGTTWFAIGNSTAIAASANCHKVELVPPIEQTNKTRSPISSEITPKNNNSELLKTDLLHKCYQGTALNNHQQACDHGCSITFNQPDEYHRNLDLKTGRIVEWHPSARINLDAGTWVGNLGQPLVTPTTKILLAEAPTSNFNRQHINKRSERKEFSHPLLPSKPVNVEVVPPPEPETELAENLKSEQPPNDAQLKVQPTFPLLPKFQPTLIGQEVDAPQTNSDSELGNLRVRELEVEPRQVDSDSELGNLRVRELEVEPRQAVKSPRRTTARLLSQVGYFQTNNIFSGVDPVDDGLFSLGLTFLATPSLGAKTALITAIDGSLIRYVDQSQFDYNQLRFRAGIRQQLSSRMYGEIGWNNQQLFRAEEGDRFLDENSIRLALQRRDRLSNKLRLDTLYEFRFSGANPESRSRIINSLAVSLSYSLKRNLQVGLDYQFALSNFTQRDRQDQYHRLLGRLSYALSNNSQVNVQTGLTSGNSSQQNIDFDNFFFSVTYTLELGKF